MEASDKDSDLTPDADKSPELLRFEATERLVAEAAVAGGARRDGPGAPKNRKSKLPVKLVKRKDDFSDQGPGGVAWRPPPRKRPPPKPRMDEATLERLRERLAAATKKTSLADLFKKHDPDGGGLDPDEFLNLVRTELRIPEDGEQGIADDDVDQLGRALDSDGGGALGMDEVQAFLSTGVVLEPEPITQAAGPLNCASAATRKFETVANNPFAPEWAAARILQKRLRTQRRQREARERATVRATNSDVALFETAFEASEVETRGRPRYAMEAQTARETVARQRLRVLGRRLVDEATALPWEPRRSTTLDVFFECPALPPSEMSLLNATGRRRRAGISRRRRGREPGRPRRRRRTIATPPRRRRDDLAPAPSFRTQVSGPSRVFWRRRGPTTAWASCGWRSATRTCYARRRRIC